MKTKHIFLLYKVSAYEHYHQSSSGARPCAGEDDRFKETHEVHYRTLMMVEQILRDKGLRFTKEARGMVTDYNPYDLVITVGGDGTFLEAARYVGGQAILGVNSDPQWSVGRLCVARADNFADTLENILSEKLQPRMISRLKITLKSEGRDVHFLNDVLICHSNPASLSRYMLHVGSICEEQRSSGVWISTATGSTGAIHSAGGSVLDVESRTMQYRPRELYQGWQGGASYQLRGGVLKRGAEIQVTSLMAEGMIFVDGSHQRIPFQTDDLATIKESESPLRIF